MRNWWLKLNIVIGISLSPLTDLLVLIVMKRKRGYLVSLKGNCRECWNFCFALCLFIIMFLVICVLGFESVWMRKGVLRCEFAFNFLSKENTIDR